MIMKTLTDVRQINFTPTIVLEFDSFVRRSKFTGKYVLPIDVEFFLVRISVDYKICFLTDKKKSIFRQISEQIGVATNNLPGEIFEVEKELWEEFLRELRAPLFYYDEPINKDAIFRLPARWRMPFSTEKKIFIRLMSSFYANLSDDLKDVFMEYSKRFTLMKPRERNRRTYRDKFF